MSSLAKSNGFIRLRCIAFGKLKTPGTRETADHYLKRIRNFSSIEELELKAYELPPEKSEGNRETALEKEATLLREKLLDRSGSARSYVCLDERGKKFTSREWASWIDQWRGRSPELTFLIGSSIGFHPGIKQSAKELIALGTQTLPHELARVVLYEQIFRALTILKGHPYHND
jgi:23S rRNA (pseudouridine1915-N3)-methyltransferase